MLRIAGGGMNIEAYDETNPFEETIENAEEYDLDQGARIAHPTFITEKMAIRFFSMFWGREDAYARRSKNGGYFPQCDKRWNVKLCPKQRGEKIFCDECENKKWTKLDVKKIVSHLLGYKEDGSDVIGVYPLLPDGTCRFLVFDFDNHEKGAETTDFANMDNEWHKEVDALRKMCKINGIKPLVERSRSGFETYLWNGNCGRMPSCGISHIYGSITENQCQICLWSISNTETRRSPG